MANVELTQQIINVNGINFAFDGSVAKKIETFKIGDPVKILRKKSGYNSQSIYAGVIVGFDNFQSFPSISVLAIKQDYGSADFVFISINEGNEDYEMIPYGEYEQLFTKQGIVDEFDKQISQAELKLSELKRKKSYFTDEFASAFQRIAK